MKNLRLILLSLAAGFIITGCNDNKNEQKGPEYSYAITFEGAQLLTGAGEYEPKYDNILWGEPKKELTSWGDNVYDGIFYTEQGASFCTYYNDYKSGGSPGDWWGGFALSSNIGMEEASSAGDYSTQFGVYASTASKFAVGYDTSYEYSTATYDKPTILFSAPQELVSARFANANKTYYYCKNNPEEVKDLYLKLIVTGFLEDEPAGKVSISLAHNAKPIEGWKEIRLDQLGMVDRIVFSFESNDFDQYGLRVPKYFCIDDIKIK